MGYEILNTQERLQIYRRLLSEGREVEAETFYRDNSSDELFLSFIQFRKDFVKTTLSAIKNRDSSSETDIGCGC